MRIKELFTVPEGEKVTEKRLGKVLFSSICSILLCMACLAGTTWAWFTVSIENRGNEIQIATVTANVSIQDKQMNAVDEDVSGKYELKPGTYTARINLGSNATGSKSPVYVVISLSHGEKTEYYYLTFDNGSKEAVQEFHVGANSVTVSFAVSWIAPAVTSATATNGETIVVGEVSDASASEPTADTTMPVTEPSAEVTTAPTTEPSTEVTTTLVTEPVETTLTTEPVKEAMQ